MHNSALDGVSVNALIRY